MTTIQIVLYDDIPSVTRTVQINNFWPANVQEVQLDGGSSEAVNIQIEGKYTDWFDI